MSVLLADDLPGLLDLHEFDEQTVALAQEFERPVDLIGRLLAEQHFASAVTFLSHCLQKNVAIIWCYDCLSDLPVSWSQQELQVLGRVESWLREPSQERRRQHGNDLHSLGVMSPVGWLGQAVFWSGGSITAPDTPDVSAAPGLFGQAVSGAVQLAGLVNDARDSSELYPRFINLGIELVKGVKEAQPPAAPGA